MFKTIAALTGLFLAMFSLASADQLNPGDAAPTPTATTEAGEQLSFAEAYQKSPYTLVFFYPKAFTGGCDAQNCALRDGYEQLTELGVSIIGVSTDSVETQKKFKDHFNLPYTLISDSEKVVLKAFQVGSFLGFSSRQAFLIKDGKVVYADHKGSTKQQADDIITFLGENS
ncbi:MAG: peroxiredoxin [Verrucomicrobiota bacterium]